MEAPIQLTEFSVNKSLLVKHRWIAKGRCISSESNLKSASTEADQELNIYHQTPGDTLTVDIGPKDFAKLKAMLEKDRRDRSPAHNPESITECIWQEMKTDNNKLLQLCRLTMNQFCLVVLTAMAGYAMAPAAFDPIGFTMVTIGTGLTSASANAINQGVIT
ncbi:protoheme IX farnesyltransferase, mitochondrial-like [Ostrea edulis]|uniref:protoheme IX farnesyltransferase, mitochondrial-like n=1 Tax=Ostrea edulis TaxID=37623 RepID=UPI0024AF1765|nr:protoheme IX farnesyltransferase, mitochondrial-like [Ostrea edulis]